MLNKRVAIKKVLESKFNVYHSGELSGKAHMNMPFLILEMTGERHIMHSHFITFSIFIYAPIKVPMMLDDCVKQVKALLNKKRIEMGSVAFFVEYTGGSAEFIDEKMHVLGRVLEFKIPLI